MGFFRKHFTKMPADVQREGLGRWFEIVEERGHILGEHSYIGMPCSIYCLFYDYGGNERFSLVDSGIDFGSMCRTSCDSYAHNLYAYCIAHALLVVGGL